jgi:hypothetical protein
VERYKACDFLWIFSNFELYVHKQFNYVNNSTMNQVIKLGRGRKKENKKTKNWGARLLEELNVEGGLQEQSI